MNEQLEQSEYNYLYEAEVNVLGSIMKDKTLMDECVLSPESFHPEWNNGLIFEVLNNACHIFAERENPFYIPDMMVHWGERLGKIGGGMALLEIERSVPSASGGMFKHYVSLVNDAHVQREMEKAVGQMAAGKTLEDMRNEINRIEEIQSRTTSYSETTSMADLIQRHTSVIMKRSQNPGGVTGAKSFSHDLNKLTKGYQKRDFVVVGARPSVGKTAFICNEMTAISEDGTAVLVISGEDGDMNLLERTIAHTGRIDLSHMKSGQMTETDWERYGKAADIIGDRKIFIDDTPAPTIESVRRKVSRMIRRYPKLVLLVDYLQHLRSEKSFGSDREMYKYISYELKQIARRFDIPVICLAALGREVDKRPDKRPIMSDIRDCGNIESDADVVIFLYRDDYYNADSPRKGIMDLIVAKGRNVGTGTVNVIFDKPFQALLNITEEERRKRSEKGFSS